MLSRSIAPQHARPAAGQCSISPPGEELSADMDPDLVQLATWLVVWILAWAILGLILITLLARRLRRIQLPPDAGVLVTLRATPLVVVLLLDLLDFSLDFLAAPFAWVLLDRLGLKGLRGVTVIETLIPGTQFIPTMTIAWLVARYASGIVDV